jgi:hypothetical protein
MNGPVVRPFAIPAEDNGKKMLKLLAWLPDRLELLYCSIVNAVDDNGSVKIALFVVTNGMPVAALVAGCANTARAMAIIIMHTTTNLIPQYPHKRNYI